MTSTSIFEILTKMY